MFVFLGKIWAYFAFSQDIFHVFRDFAFDMEVKDSFIFHIEF